jgi:hypothetical protein
MKRTVAALGAFAIIGFGVLFGVAPASAASCIQSTAGCAPAMTYNGAMSHDGADGMPFNGAPAMTFNSQMTHNGPSVICRTFPPC